METEVVGLTCRAEGNDDMFTQFNLQELTALGDFFCYHFVFLTHFE